MSHMKASVARWLATRRRNPVISLADRLAVDFHRAVANLDYDSDANGERRVIRVGFGRGAPVILDVGANNGSWSLMAAELSPESRIWAFEIVPDTFRALTSRTSGKPGIVPVPLGLSDREERVTVYCVPGRDELATCLPNLAGDFHGAEAVAVEAEVTTGARFCESEGIERIDLLKIDVEGLEPQVLRGFEPMLSDGRIDAVQVEYGFGNVESKFLLRDFHSFFESRDMAFGKIFPTYVDFRPYRFEDEDFLGPNYLAVRRERRDLLEQLGR